MLYQQKRRLLILCGAVLAAGHGGADGCRRGRRRDKSSCAYAGIFERGFFRIILQQ